MELTTRTNRAGRALLSWRRFEFPMILLTNGKVELINQVHEQSGQTLCGRGHVGVRERNENHKTI